MTSCGLNGGPLQAVGTYEARIACNLWAAGHVTGRVDGSHPARRLAQHPYFTQTGGDREHDGDQYIANMRDGAAAGFKYFAFDGHEKSLSVCGCGQGMFEVSDGERLIAAVPVNGSAPIRMQPGVYPLFFTYRGGDAADLISFTIDREA